MRVQSSQNLRSSLGTLTCFGLLTVCSAQPNAAPDLNQIVEKMVKSEDCQLKKLQQYRMTRTYELKSGDGSKDTLMLTRVNYNGALGKSIQVLEERGTDGLYRRALHKILEVEVRTSRSDGRGDTRLAPENYNFRLLGEEVRDGRKCYVLQLLPKKKSKYLLDGKAWVAIDDYGLVALEGRPSATVSFWVGRPLITQSFEKVGEFWLMSRNHSEVDAKIVGRIQLNIETRDVEMGGTKVELAARPRSAHSPIVD